MTLMMAMAVAVWVIAIRCVHVVMIVMGVVLMLTQYRRIKEYFICYPDLPIVEKNSQSTFEVDYSRRFWIHQVNSIDKLLAVKDRFQGIEIDIYDDTVAGKIEICHWLDFKNLCEVDKRRISGLIAIFDSITSHYSIEKKNIIIESSDLIHASACKTLFSRMGFSGFLSVSQFENSIDR